MRALVIAIGVAAIATVAACGDDSPSNSANNTVPPAEYKRCKSGELVPVAADCPAINDHGGNVDTE